MNQIIYSEQETDYINDLKFFYKNVSDHTIDMIQNINEGKSNISLRILDWFAFKYIKYGSWQNDIQMSKFHKSYKIYYNLYGKSYFDPFCRQHKMTDLFGSKSDKILNTSIGQLNFYRWTIENNILQYIEKNYDIIINEMKL
jgi:hypothetical protein